MKIMVTMLTGFKDAFFFSLLVIWTIRALPVISFLFVYYNTYVFTSYILIYFKKNEVASRIQFKHIKKSINKIKVLDGTGQCIVVKGTQVPFATCVTSHRLFNFSELYFLVHKIFTFHHCCEFDV